MKKMHHITLIMPHVKLKIYHSGTWRINDLTLMLCLFTSVCWPSFSFTTMRSLTIVSGPYSDNTRLHSFSDPHLCAVRPRDARSCSVFLSSQWRAQRLTSETSTSASMKINRSSLTPVHLHWQGDKIMIPVVLVSMLNNIIYNNFWYN